MQADHEAKNYKDEVKTSLHLHFLGFYARAKDEGQLMIGLGPPTAKLNIDAIPHFCALFVFGFLN